MGRGRGFQISGGTFSRINRCPSARGVSGLTYDTWGHPQTGLFENWSFWKRLRVHVAWVPNLPPTKDIWDLSSKSVYILPVGQWDHHPHVKNGEGKRWLYITGWSLRWTSKEAAFRSTSLEQCKSAFLVLTKGSPAERGCVLHNRAENEWRNSLTPKFWKVWNFYTSFGICTLQIWDVWRSVDLLLGLKQIRAGLRSVNVLCQ